MKLVHEIKRRIDEQQPHLWSKQISCDKDFCLTEAKNIEGRMYFIKEGTIRIFLDSDDQEYTIRFGYPGTFICSFDSFINGTPSIFTVQSIKKCVLMVIEKEQFMGFVHSSKVLLDLWNDALCEIILQQVRREIDLITTQPIDRINRLLKRNPKVFQEIPRKYIASYLRMTPETLSRLLKY